MAGTSSEPAQGPELRPVRVAPARHVAARSPSAVNKRQSARTAPTAGAGAVVLSSVGQVAMTGRTGDD
jgi:hypothetical protein